MVYLAIKWVDLSSSRTVNVITRGYCINGWMTISHGKSHGIHRICWSFGSTIVLMKIETRLALWIPMALWIVAY